MNFCRWSYNLAPQRFLFFTIFASLASPSFATGFPITVETRRVVWIERFTQYVQWPKEHKVNKADVPFHLCILNDRAFFQLVEALLSERKIRGKAVTLYHQQASDLNDACDVLFISEQEKDNLPALTSWAKEKQVLLISAAKGFGARGVHINMYEEEKLQKFEINQRAAIASGLHIDARLLRMGRLVAAEETP